MNSLTVKIPTWVNKDQAQEDFFRNLMGKALLKMEFYRSRMKPFEVKYQIAFTDFQKQVQNATVENFKAWDDLIEWEAYHAAFAQWKERYQELEKWFKK